MPDKMAGRRIREWARRPDRAMTYGPFARLSDWFCAVRDARAGMAELLVPALDEAADPHIGQSKEAGQKWATPRTVLLGQLGRGQAEKAWIRYQADVAEVQIQLIDARTKCQTAGGRRTAVEQRLADLAAPTEEERGKRMSGEENTDLAVLADCRMREYTERRRVIESELNRIVGAVAESESEIARLQQTINTRFEVVQAQAEIIDAYVRRRCAAYLTKLIRKHPKGEELSVLVRNAAPEQPRWSTWDGRPDNSSRVWPAANLTPKTGDT
jgi:hypothetical protein